MLDRSEIGRQLLHRAGSQFSKMEVTFENVMKHRRIKVDIS